jgi:Holliday junction DNA helicase RuvA
MIEYIKGEISELSPTYVVLETSGVGYYINISLNTYSEIENQVDAKLYIYEVIREDAHILYGFATKKERFVFERLISVSGVGANTARLILSSLSPDEVVYSIANNKSSSFKAIKGIGNKTAERIVIDLKDKVKNIDVEIDYELVEKKNDVLHNRNRNDALSALVALGYNKKEAEKALNKVIASVETDDVADLVRESLKILTT